MIRLNNVSKYYHNEGNVVLGLRKIYLELKIGEFVAITGESGSGKSTLLNVISGLDTYEDGELFINGEETSHYDETDWENYRRNYIGFVFQNYNLIDSYTVLENVETALIISGLSREERRKKALDILNRVGLGKHLNHKATKLSGGEMQRLAIARAIAKDAPIIVADEPTGNLDSKTGEQIMELLHEISQEKLVIMVTHNYGLVEKYVTRKIRIYDGEIAENTIYKAPIAHDEVNLVSKNVPFFKKALAFTFLNIKNQPRRSIFMLMVTLITTLVISLVFGQILIAGLNAESSHSGYNSYFQNATQDRIVILKKDQKPITIEEFNKLKELENVDLVIKEDIVLDLAGTIRTDFFYIKGGVSSVNKIKESDLMEGRLPTKDNEVLVTYNYDNFPVPLKGKFFLESKLQYGGFELVDVEVVGIVKERYPNEIYLTDNLLKQLYNVYNYYLDEHKLTLKFPEGYSSSQLVLNKIVLVADEKIADDEIFVSASFLDEYDPEEIAFIGSISGSDRTFNVRGTGDIRDPHYTYGTVRVSPAVYAENIIDINDYYQHSIFVKKIAKVDDTVQAIRSMGYYAFSPYKASSFRYYDLGSIVSQIAVILFSIIVIFCIYMFSFLVIKTILNSKKRDYAILRSVGLDVRTIKVSILLEVIIAFIVAFIILFVAVFSIKLKSIKELFNMYHWHDYLIVFVINIFIGVLTSLRYNRKMIEKSLVAQTKVES